jgi:hypothetical protein
MKYLPVAGIRHLEALGRSAYQAHAANRQIGATIVSNPELLAGLNANSNDSEIDRGIQDSEHWKCQASLWKQ